jgi:hypothetical protein
MDKWFKVILPDKDPYHNRGRDQMRKKGGSGIRVPVVASNFGNILSKILKQILSIPTNTADPAVYILTGAIPIKTGYIY